MSDSSKLHALEYQSPSNVRRLNFGDYAVAALFSALVALWLLFLVAGLLIKPLVPEKAETLKTILLIVDAALMIAAGVFLFRVLIRWPQSGD